MRALKDILHGIPVRHVVGNLNVAIADLCFDSRKVTPDSMFVAVVGTQVDGHHYIDNAVALGASVVLCEKMPKATKDEVTYIQVEDTRSEEHTSELQSLMRISYAVFCLNKKKKQ